MNNPREIVHFVRPSMGYKPQPKPLRWWQAILLSGSIIVVYYALALLALHWFEAFRHVSH